MKWNYVVVEGNIGAGKTTLATMLSAELNARLILEQFEDNLFLPVFYDNPEKYAFPLELSFVADRYQQLRDALSRPDLFAPRIISDYYILKSLIFARVNLPELEFSLFEKLFRIVFDALPSPDLIIYLNSDVERLKKNIHTRGRKYEENIKNEYLEQIHNSYAAELKSIQDIPVLVVDATDIDFVKDPGIFQNMLNLLANDYKNGLNYIKM